MNAAAPWSYTESPPWGMKEKLNTCAPSAGECGGSFEFGARDLIGQRIFWGAELTRWVLLHPRFCPFRHIWQIFAGGENRKKLIKNQIQGLERWDKNHSVEEVCAHILVPKAMFWGMGKTQNFATNTDEDFQKVRDNLTADFAAGKKTEKNL